MICPTCKGEGVIESGGFPIPWYCLNCDEGIPLSRWRWSMYCCDECEEEVDDEDDE
jgi:hypothetical protein